MKPSNEEIDAAVENKAKALKEFARVSAKETAISLKVKAARHQLLLARQAENALTNDLIVYSK